MSTIGTTPRHPRGAPLASATSRRGIAGVAWAIAAVGLALRLLTVWATHHATADGRARLHGDALGYDNLALDLLAGRGFTWPGRVPLYPLWVAALHRLFGADYAAFYYAQALLGALVVPLTFALGRRVGGALVGLVAACLAAVSYVLVVQPAALMSEVLFTPLVLAVAITLGDLLDDPSPRRAAATGLATGLANLVRPTLVLFPLVVVALLAWRVRSHRAWRLAFLSASATLLVQSPWMVHNARLGRPVWTLATSNAILWQGSPEYYHLTHDSGYTYLRVWNDVIYAHRDPAPDPGTVEGERYWRGRALRSIASEPLTYLRYAAEKAAAYWIGDHNADWGDSYPLDYHALRAWGFSPQATVAVVAARSVVPLLALVAIVLLRRRWRRLLAIYALLSYCTLLHAATHAEARLSEPLQPLLLVLIAAGAVELAARSRASASEPA